LTDNEVNRLIATAIDVSTKMQERFGIPLRLIIIDTLLAAFPINDWNSPAEVSRVMAVLARIARGRSPGRSSPWQGRESWTCGFVCP
jgi:hypothetical protein